MVKHVTEAAAFHDHPIVDECDNIRNFPCEAGRLDGQPGPHCRFRRPMARGLMPTGGGGLVRGVTRPVS